MTGKLYYKQYNEVLGEGLKGKADENEPERPFYHRSTHPS